MPSTELTIVGLLTTGIGAMFVLYQRGVSQSIAAKDAEITWLRTQLDSWTEIGRSAVKTAERLTESKP